MSRQLRHALANGNEAGEDGGVVHDTIEVRCHVIA